jgi:hypothetical protein
MEIKHLDMKVKYLEPDTGFEGCYIEYDSEDKEKDLSLLMQEFEFLNEYPYFNSYAFEFKNRFLSSDGSVVNGEFIKESERCNTVANSLQEAIQMTKAKALDIMNKCDIVGVRAMPIAYFYKDKKVWKVRVRLMFDQKMYKEGGQDVVS